MSFDLNSISKTRRVRAPKIVVGGPNKIGKTTFASHAPASIGILTEDGADAVDAQAFPLAQTLNDVYQAISTLITEKHEFQTVFIDSLDWLEPMVQAHVCAANNWKHIEQPGFGKGYIAAAEEWRNFLNGLETLRAERQMGVILICHDKVKRVEDPLTEGYDAHVLKLHDRAGALVQEWADVIGYAGYKIFTDKTPGKGMGQKETKAGTTGERILYVEPHPGHFGGNRFGLKNMALDWATFSTALSTAQGDI